MSHEKRWSSTLELGLKEFWGARTHRTSSSRRSHRIEDEPTDGLLDQLDVGQSLTILWQEGAAEVAIEEPAHCSSCGEALTELRLSCLFPSLSVCPNCGDPPSA